MTLYTTVEVAAYLKMSRFSVYNLVKRKLLNGRMVLNKLRFTQEDLDRYLKSTSTTDARKQRPKGCD